MVIRETILQYVPVNKNESRGIQKYPAPKGENNNGFEIRFKKSGDKKGDCSYLYRAVPYYPRLHSLFKTIIFLLILDMLAKVKCKS